MELMKRGLFYIEEDELQWGCIKMTSDNDWSQKECIATCYNAGTNICDWIDHLEPTKIRECFCLKLTVICLLLNFNLLFLTANIKYST